MEIAIVDFVEGAQQADGVVVVVDVFRAFSVACYAFANGASKIIPVGEVDDARRFKQEICDCILIGERGGKKLDGFDFGNSPTEIQEVDLSGKTLVHTTHSGTQGLVNVTGADAVFTGAFVNAAATIRYIKSLNPGKVTLVRMGFEAESRTDEDDLCAEYLKALLENTAFDIGKVYENLRSSPSSARFFDQQQPWSPTSDFDLCLEIDKFEFPIQAVQDENNMLFLKRIFL